MDVMVRIQIDQEAARDFNRRLEAKTTANVTFLDFLEDGIKREVEKVDRYGRVVEVRLG